ncbi:hypothetical protein ACFSX5_10155 [Devosia albogilva]|uniref:Uncharacterized protein n=1 Tax=Devosia albogilva TaxID=429726 RepID=A0ABW5QK79_9HYPH
MSSTAIFSRPAIRWGAYALAGLLFAAEAGVVWLMLNPDVPEDFRAYYIDRSTTCLNQPVPGTYAFGTVVDFTSDGREQAMPLRVCGWEGPAGDGTHAVGTSSRLRFRGDPQPGAHELVLDLAAISRDGDPQPQRVEVLIDGELTNTLDVALPEPQSFRLPVPDDVLADGTLELILRFPDAVQMGETDPDTRYRSVKLTRAGIVPAGQDAVEEQGRTAVWNDLARSGVHGG